MVVGKNGRVEDVTAVVSLGAGRYCASASPIYGIPGIYLNDGPACRVTKIIPGTHYYNDDPKLNMLDYFKLKSASYQSHRLQCVYWYNATVDSVDEGDPRTLVLRDTVVVVK
jgi:hypothetical protein